jgi:hypothetical protein
VNPLNAHGHSWYVSFSRWGFATLPPAEGPRGFSVSSQEIHWPDDRNIVCLFIANIKGFSRENQGFLKAFMQRAEYTPRHEPGRYALKTITAAPSGSLVTKPQNLRTD